MDWFKQNAPKKTMFFQIASQHCKMFVELQGFERENMLVNIPGHGWSCMRNFDLCVSSLRHMGENSVTKHSNSSFGNCFLTTGRRFSGTHKIVFTRCKVPDCYTSGPHSCVVNALFLEAATLQLSFVQHLCKHCLCRCPITLPASGKFWSSSETLLSLEPLGHQLSM